MDTKNNRFRIFSGLLIIIMLLPGVPLITAQAEGVCYVKWNASGTNSGTSWANAYTDLQSALGTSPCTEIWVAAGLYKPTTGASRSTTFQLKNGVAIYGGFNGTETVRTERNPEANLTILSGDIDNNDSQTPIITDLTTVIGNTTNSYNVVTGATGATLDGFTITAGNADVGIACPSSCGGGMYNYYSFPTLTNLVFRGNRAVRGGGMANYFRNPTITNVTFWENDATRGGGMYNYTASPVLTNVTFSDNSASYGGGMYNFVDSNPILRNVTISSNTASTDGGGIYSYSNCNPSLTNVTIGNNSAAGVGGGMYNYNNSPQIHNTILWGNTAPSGAQIKNDSSFPIVSDSVVQGGYAGGTNIIPTDPLLGALGNYGGSTQTLPLQTGSSAINTGNDATCLATDQRGTTRPQGAHCDIGSYEYIDNYYAKPAASGNGDCKSWANACTLQTALTSAVNGEEIWVAAGTHIPGSLRTDTFQLVDGVAVYGGFAGTETLRDQRNWTANVTILSGDLADDDSGFSNNSENAYHVVTGASGAILDGFTITAGNADGADCLNSGCGGGMYNDSTSPSITNVIFSGNNAFNGGGMANDNSTNTTLTNVTFSGNQASDGGGGLYNLYSNPTLTDVTFSSNATDGWGGGLYSYGGSPVLINVTFNDNMADSGGGLANYDSNASLTNITISGNTAVEFGGGIVNLNSSSPILKNVTLSGNSADIGGGMYNDVNSSPAINNTIIWGNSAPSGAQIHNNDGSSVPSVFDSVVQDGYVGGTNIINTDPLLDTLGNNGGNTQTILLQVGSSAIDTGNNSTCATTDQRGIPRPQGVACDIGAFEVGNLPPTVNLSNFISVLSENSDTSSAIKVADITITDDGLGTNNLTLSGAGTALFEIVGVELFLKAGSLLDYETYPTLIVTVEVDDSTIGGFPDASDTFSITLSDVNEAPAITSNGGGTTASLSVAENGTDVTTDTATDPDAGATLTYSISGGADAALFTIDPSTGVLAFASAPDFENPSDDGVDNIYDVNVQVTDGYLTDSQDIAITVTDMNEIPSVDLSNITTTTLPENTNTSDAIKIAGITITDDALGTNILSLSGADAALFEIVGSELFLKAGAVLDFETNPTLNITVAVDDSTIGGNPDDTDSLAITVTNVNETPVITSNGGGATASLSVSEGTTAVTTVTATDVDAGTTLNYSISGGADAAKFTINLSSGVLSFISAPVYGTPQDVGGNNVYDVIVQVSDGSLTDSQALAVSVTNTMHIIYLPLIFRP